MSSAMTSNPRSAMQAAWVAPRYPVPITVRRWATVSPLDILPAQTGVPAGSMRVMSPDFPAYAPSEEHELLRQTVRELADAKIAPHAAEVDEESRFPKEALDALVQNELHAVHVPEAYGGAGADALA